MKSQSEAAQSCPTLSDPTDCTYQAPPSMGFSRQEYRSGVPLPSAALIIAPYNLAPESLWLCFFTSAIKSPLRRKETFLLPPQHHNDIYGQNGRSIKSGHPKKLISFLKKQKAVKRVTLGQRVLNPKKSWTVKFWNANSSLSNCVDLGSSGSQLLDRTF